MVQFGGPGSVVVTGNDADGLGEVRSEFADRSLHAGDNRWKWESSVFASEVFVEVTVPVGGRVLVVTCQWPTIVALLDESLAVADEESTHSFAHGDPSHPQ